MKDTMSRLSKAAQKIDSSRPKAGKIFLPWDQLYSKEQVRESFENIEELAKTIHEKGQKQPVIVFPKDETGKYLIYMGERRWRACKELNKDVWVSIEENQLTGPDVVVGQLIENIQKDSLKPAELAKSFNKLQTEFSMTQEQIAKEVGKSQSFVSKHLALVSLPPCVKDALGAEDITDVDTLVALKLLYDIDPDRCEKVCASAAETPLTRAKAQDILNDARETQKKVQAEQNKEKGMSLGDQDREADREHQRELNEAGLNEQSGVQELDGMEGGSADEDTSEKADAPKEPKYPAPKGGAGEGGADFPGLTTGDGWIERDPQHASYLLEVMLPDSTVHRAILALDRVDPDAEYLWVRISDKGGDAYHRVHVEDAKFIKVIQ